MPSPQAEASEPEHRQAWWPDTVPATDSLTGPHLDILIRAVLRIVDTEAAQDAYSQIADGAPLEDGINFMNWVPSLYHGDGNPLKGHKTLCPGAVEKFQAFRANFKVESLEYNKKALMEYNAVSPGSTAFKMRLVELVAVAVHQIAVLLWNLDQGVHKHEDVSSWRPGPTDEMYWRNFPDGLPWPPFRHDWYTSWKQYPNGHADIVGYWAEWRIIGGIVLFDRRYPEASPENIFLHPAGIDTTYRICLLNPDQRHSLIDFLFREDEPDAACPLPIVVSDDNRHRVDPEDDIVDTGIYRDIWERAPLTLEDGDERLRDVCAHVDYPSAGDKNDAIGRARLRRERLIREKVEREGGCVNDYL